MKILIVNKYYYFRGGAETSAIKQLDLFEKHNHEVRFFSMKHPNNLEYKYEYYFAPHIDFMDEFNKRTITSKFKVINNIFYSTKTRKSFSRLLDDFKPDVIHVHNFNKHLTISILFEAKKRHIPVVKTLHDCSMICPSGVFLSHKKICEKCKSNRLSPIFEKCVKNSTQASIISTAERLFNDFMGLDKLINSYISPSKFVKDKYVEFGYNVNKINVLPNFYPLSNKFGKIKLEKYFLYLGRLSPEKGIKTLCEAAKLANINLKIVGDGPLIESLKSEYSSKNLVFLGYKQGNELKTIRENAWFTVLPSECYENNPFSVIESFSDGVPAIGSDIGGIPELILDDETGFLFEPRSVSDLAQKLKLANQINSNKRKQLITNAENLLLSKYDPETHYYKLMKIYNKVIKENNETNYIRH